MEPIKIGWLGSALDGPGGGYDKHPPPGVRRGRRAGPARPAGRVRAPRRERPAATASAKNATDGFRCLVDEGCIGVAGAYSSDNAITVGPLANELAGAADQLVRAPSGCRATTASGSATATAVATPRSSSAGCKRNGHERVARAQRDLAERRGVLPLLPPGVPPARRRDRRGRDRQPDPRRPRRRTSTTCARSNPTRSSTWATGCSRRRDCCARRSTSSAWDPPRIMGTAFMFYLMGFDKFEGWVGIDQFDPSNPLVEGFHERYVARYGEDPPMWPNAIPVLAYDTARVLVEGLFRAPILVGPGPEGRARDDPLHAEHHRRTAHPHRVLALRARHVPRRLAALRPRPRRQARVRRPVRALGVGS